MTSAFDPGKEAENLAKHGVTIENGAAVGERRWITIGVNAFGMPLLVVWTERDEGIRLISVRRPTAKERGSYEKGI